jgi:hypothetical protein
MLYRRMFPVMVDRKYRDRCPVAVPFALVQEHEQQARNNHWQTVQRLSERGGLAPCELLAVLEDREHSRMDHQEAISRLLIILEEYEQRWEKAFDEKFVMDYDNIPGQGPTFLFMKNDDGKTMKIATPDDVKNFIRSIFEGGR